MEYNLAKGNVFVNIFRFLIPYMIAYFLQTLYGMADLFIAGQFHGADIISAISTGSQIMHMFTVMIAGLSLGTTVITAKAVGAEDQERKRRVIGNTVTLFLLLSLILTPILSVSSGNIVSILMIPEEAYREARRYLTICFLGIPFITGYNVLSAIFRGLGDSKSPMKFIALSTAINIILDFILMGFFKMGAVGASLATVLSQAVSLVYALLAVLRISGRSDISLIKKPCLRDVFLMLIPDKTILKELLSTGLPIACQDGFIQLSFLAITAIANNRGLEISAAVGIVEKTISFLFLFPSSMLSAVSTISAQCIGAGDTKKAGSVLKIGIMLDITSGLFFTVLFQRISEPFFGLFTSDPTVCSYAAQYMKTYVIDCIFAGIHFPFSGYFSASGLSILSFLHNIISVFLVRIPGAWISSVFFPDTLYAMGMAAPLGSLLSVILCSFFYGKYCSK